MTDIFGNLETDYKYTRNGLIKKLKNIINQGWEISWFTTDKISFGWEDINSNVDEFLKKLETLDFKRVDVAYFNSEKKQTYYDCYELIEDECEHQFILDCDTGLLTGRMYCIKCSKDKCNHELAYIENWFGDGEGAYDYFCKYCKKWEWDW